MKLRHPKKLGEVWVHVDKFSKKKGKRPTWAVQYIGRSGNPVYRVVQRVIHLIPMQTKEWCGPMQPKAVLVSFQARAYFRADGVAMIGSAK